MISQAPNKILFIADGNEAELFTKPKELVDKAHSDLFWYRFTKSREKNGREFGLTLKHIANLMAVKLLKNIS